MPYASIDAEKEIGPVLNIEIYTVFDLPGVEVQVPSLGSPGYSVWILISRGHERFVNEIHRHNSDIMNYSSSLRAKDENLNDVLRIFQTCRGKSRARLTRFEQCLKRRLNLQACIGKPLPPRYGQPRPPRKAAAAVASAAAIPCQYIREQSPTVEKKRILREDRIRTTIPE